MPQKICLIIGAGCTVADASNSSIKNRPPLDNNFFSIASTTNAQAVNRIKLYAEENYGLNILAPEYDSLEKIMAKIYTDVFSPYLKDKASEVFRELIRLFNRRLADTTNKLSATRGRYLYRIIRDFLNTGVAPANITIITFNQDIQIEKILNKLEQTEIYKAKGKIFDFPSCYSIDFSSITAPRQGKELFAKGDAKPGGIKLLKLHGSLNWYSIHKSTNISAKAMFRANRSINVTRRHTIDPQMRHTGSSRSQQTLPVIVPPVAHKSAILHDNIRPLWRQAEKTLKNADEIVIFGYSCPTMDFESSNLIQRAMRNNSKYENIWVIDPDPNVLIRYIDLIKPLQITYHQSANDYLQRR